MDNVKRIPKREDIPAADKWALEDLYPSEDAWEQDMAVLAEETQCLAGFSGKLAESGEILCSYLQQLEKSQVRMSRLANYCMRKADEDTREPKYQGMRGRCMAAIVKLESACSFATPEIMEIEDQWFAGFFEQYPRLERYRRYLNDLRRMRQHTLSAAEEKLLASAGEIAQTPADIYNSFANADMKYPDAVDAEGNAHPLSNGSFVALENSADRVLRKSAYENLYGTLANHQNTAAALLNGQNKQLKFFAEARHYDSAFEASLDKTQVPTTVYLNLIEAVHRNLDKMHRYIRLRKQILGVDELHFYDIYTPLIPEVDKEISFAEAKQTVYDSLYPLGEDYRKILKEGFDNRWIDVYENVGKRSGAYSAGAAVHPYVLLNYTGTLDSQFTLTHEMGHALHSYYSNKKQNPLDAEYVIFVAEVASTCNEALLMEYLLSKTKDKKERAYLINHFLDQFRGTLYRQTMFAEFELSIGRMTAEGKTLTAELLCQEYRRLNELYYGPDIVVDDAIALEWARIPHFYYDYYVFQYATGYSAAIALSRKILAEGECAVQNYLEFLSGGCSKSPIDLLKGAGVDMTGPEPVEQALSLFGTLLDEMEDLMKE